MARYAADTDVSVEKSQAEIQRILRRYGATKFGYAIDDSIPAAVLRFEVQQRQVQIYVPLPRRDDPEFVQTGSNQYRRAGQPIPGAYDRAVRQRWRAVVLYLKALVEAIEAGIISFQTAFLAHMLLPNGVTVGQWAEPQVDESYRTGQMPPLLPGLPPRALPEGSPGSTR